MKLLHGRSTEVVQGRLVKNADGETVLALADGVTSPLAALEEGLVLLDASDEERMALVEAGYAIPAEPAPTETTNAELSGPRMTRGAGRRTRR